MKIIFFSLFFGCLSFCAFAQGMQVKPGDHFPDIPIQNLINAPVKSVSPGKPQNKIFILNIWGTWCSPCLPEMDSLAKLQLSNPNTIQVVAILFSLAYVGQSIIVNPAGNVVALVRSDSINQNLINKLLKGENVKSNGETKEKPVNNSDDIFGVDSTLNHSFTVKGYMKGQPSGSRRYSGKSKYNGRRISFTNATIVGLLKDAYGIVSDKQLVYEIPVKEVSDYENKQTLYCVDLLVKPDESDSLMQILQKKLLSFLPVKVRMENREMPVYALVNKSYSSTESKNSQMSYSFSGRGYDGQGVTMAEFAEEYLTNESSIPVIDETGLTKKYDIKTSVEVRTKEGILKSINDIGLDLVKKDKKMEVLVFYR
ncbi:MAG: TIGR03435 family protein [Pedobacter sp.]|nr:MAG: TIGR03435 family protein [Pedobacter sp.]